MTRIGLISDTHGFLDETVAGHFRDCDEIWHGGDWGGGELVEGLSKMTEVTGLIKEKRLRGVYGNIDGYEVRSIYPEQLVFMCEDVKVMIRHIGGSPPRYNPDTRRELLLHKPLLFISGHSHILKVMYDEKMGCLHMNPGAAGKQGWQKMRTLIRFVIDGRDMKDCEVIELGKR